MPILQTNFRDPLPPELKPLEIGQGKVYRDADAIRLVVERTSPRGYSDAQLFDYQGLRRRDLPWHPPLRMTVRAWASHSAERLKGTAGFGFWNQPVMPGQMIPRLPRQVWFFFGSPPSNMAFAQGVPGFGWKAGVLDMSRVAFLILAPFAPLGFLLTRLPSLYRVLWPVGQRAIGADEKNLDVDLREPHTYRLDWLRQTVCFYVDDAPILQTRYSPRGPLGFVTWLDNQYAVATPQGQIGMGLIPVSERQWLAIESVRIESL